jgi:hypothetical protein
MKVVVVKPAFYNGFRVRVGTELNVPDELKGSWFVHKDAVPTPPVTGGRGRKPKDAPQTLSQMAKGETPASFIDVHKGEGDDLG